MLVVIVRNTFFCCCVYIVCVLCMIVGMYCRSWRVHDIPARTHEQPHEQRTLLHPSSSSLVFSVAQSAACVALHCFALFTSLLVLKATMPLKPVDTSLIYAVTSSSVFDINSALEVINVYYYVCMHFVRTMLFAFSEWGA